VVNGKEMVVHFLDFFLPFYAVSYPELTLNILDKDLMSHFLPAGLLAHFSITEVSMLGEVSSKKMFFEIHLEENNEILGVSMDLNMNQKALRR